MNNLLSDEAVAARVLQHIRARTTDVGDAVWREPVANYLSEERLARELAVLRRTATPFCPSAALPEPGAYVARVAAGTPLLAVRDQDGVVRVFRNACRHRGTELADGSGCAKAFVCRYHGWTYRLDGRLQHIPHADGFPGVAREQYGLTPVAAEERHGLVFVTQEPGDTEPPVWEDLPELITPDQFLLGSGANEVDVNWKVYLEGFLEGYHIRSTHPQSFYPYGYDNLTLVEHSGRNSRITFPFRRIEKLADVPAAERRIDGLLTYVYHLFPNTFVTVLSHHTNLVVLEPLTLGRTRFVIYTLTNRGAGADAAATAQRDAAFVNDTGAAEDLAIVMSIQRSITSGANEVFTFGTFETAIAHFHRNMRRALGEAVS
jgi:phenylpropionate dioxygenase-like ring-hydroxylating dioxygenase large terminal subunit